MTSVGRVAQCTSLLVLLSCGDNGDQGGTPVEQISQGLKIFVTARTHPADFASDPYLNGSDAVQKADDFCNTDPNKPAQGTYKALIVDGVIRDAKTRTNWVLQPNTTYYRTYDDVEIGTTTSAAIFGAAYKPLTNPVDRAPSGGGDMGSWKWAWTGIGSATDFTAGGDSCAAWSDMTYSHDGWTGVTHVTDGNAFANMRWGCANAWNHLYCVQQP